MISSVLLTVGGLVLVVKGARWLVDGASSIARRYGIAPIVIGLTIVAFGTSMPELVVNLFAAVENHAGLAIGNIIGSNISNILLILGIAAVICPLAVRKNTVAKEIPLALLAVVLLLVLVNDRIIAGRMIDMLDRTDGIVLLAFFIIFIYYTFGISRVEGQDGKEMIMRMPKWKAYGLILLGMLGLFLGGKFTVDGASVVALQLGISENLLGLTVIALGSSLPELATSVVASFRKEADIAIGNIVGSNIFNTFWVLGVSATVKDLPFSIANSFDVVVAIAATLILLVAVFIGKRNILEKWEGWMFIGLYFAYVAFLIYRG